MKTPNEIALRNLLARIHRDGGHYTDMHGVEKSAADAEAKVVEMLQSVEELKMVKAERDALKRRKTVPQTLKEKGQQ